MEVDDRSTEGSDRACDGIPRPIESRGMLNSAERSRSAEGDFGEVLIRGADG